MRGKRLQIEKDGVWQWVFCRAMPSHKVITTDEKQKALKEHSLAFFTNEYANDKFRVAESLTAQSPS